MFKNKSYSQNQNMKLPKHMGSHNVKSVDIKPNTNNKTYEKKRYRRKW